MRAATPWALTATRFASLGSAAALVATLCLGAEETPPKPAEKPPATQPGAKAPAPPAQPAPAAKPGSSTPEAKPAAPAPAAKPPAPAPTGPSAAAPQPPAVAVKGLDPKDAKGVLKLGLELPRPLRLGGFAFVATFDPQAFAVTDPESSAALQGYLCQANTTVAGTVRYSCVGIPQEDKAGSVATLAVHYRDRLPKVEDFKVTQNEVVDEYGRLAEGTQLVLVAPKP